jgi:transcriptional regulator with XRE-family HTH domain
VKTKSERHSRSLKAKKTLRDLRKERNLTQAELGKIIGLHPVTISLYETGQANPLFATLRKFADGFRVNLTEIDLRDFS